MSHPSMIRGALACVLLGAGLGAAAQTPALFKDADLKLGEKLIAQHKCNQCHAQKWADDGKAIYRPKGRVNTPALLQGHGRALQHAAGPEPVPRRSDGDGGGAQPRP